MAEYLIIDNIADDGYEECDFCTNKVDPNCLEPDEKNLAEEGGGYACSACADNYKEHFYQYNEAFYCVNIGDIVYDKPGKILGKCFYKSNHQVSFPESNSKLIKKYIQFYFSVRNLLFG